jgi:hypothetical protein
MSAQDQDTFKYRHMTISPNFKYNDNLFDCPYDYGEGFIAYWQDGDHGLKRSSMPKNVSAVYKSINSPISNMVPENAEIDEYGLYWKYSDEYYKQTYFQIQNHS